MRAAVTGATAACLQTLTNRWIAVIEVSTSMIHRIGISNGSNSRPMQIAMIRSARSISPPLALIPSDSAFARW